jgi:hypothetical protein
MNIYVPETWRTSQTTTFNPNYLLTVRKIPVSRELCWWAARYDTFHPLCQWMEIRIGNCGQDYYRPRSSNVSSESRCYVFFAISIISEAFKEFSIKLVSTRKKYETNLILAHI